MDVDESLQKRLDARKHTRKYMADLLLILEKGQCDGRRCVDLLRLLPLLKRLDLSNDLLPLVSELGFLLCFIFLDLLNLSQLLMGESRDQVWLFGLNKGLNHAGLLPDLDVGAQHSCELKIRINAV